jgi:hypothetical protein
MPLASLLSLVLFALGQQCQQPYPYTGSSPGIIPTDGKENSEWMAEIRNGFLIAEGGKKKAKPSPNQTDYRSGCE